VALAPDTATTVMTLTLNIPDLLLSRLEAVCHDVPRTVLEGFAADAGLDHNLGQASIMVAAGRAWDRRAQ
jgi:hypothetical protein